MAIDMLIIKRDIYDRIIEQAKKGKPSEVCGILVGKGSKVLKLYEMDNTSDNPRLCYFMNPKEQIEVFKDMRKQNLELVAIYHSHPDTEAYPSKRDVELAFYPESVYLIISLKDEEKTIIRGFWIVEEEIKEIEVKIVEEF